MLKFKSLLLTAVCAVATSNLFAQCPAGEVEITIDVHTDDYGYETYWELLPAGNQCGNGTIFSGGNPAVGCNGAGAQVQPTGGYANNTTYNEGPWCLTENDNFSILFNDDWGDAGLVFDVMVNGYVIATYTGDGLGNVFTFAATEPVAYDLQTTAIVEPFTYVNPGNNSIIATVKNLGTATITDMDVHYQIDGGAIETMNLTGLNIANFEEYTYTHPTPWNASIGNYNIKVWTSNLNGNADMNTINDHLFKDFEVGPGIPNLIDQYLSTAVTETEIGNAADGLDMPRDLDFHPVLSRKELWVVNEKTENSGGTTVTYTNTGEPTQTSEAKQDGNAWHFMSLPTGIAFGENEMFATSTGVFDANHQGSGNPFTGPTLWSSDPIIYAQPSGGNGSHMDMLHVSPYCMGIAHEKGNAYWVTDGYNSDVVMYDFVIDHGPGNSDHSDGIVRRYADEPVLKDPNNKVPNHLVLDKTSNWLYVVDYGNQRVIRIDITTGTQGATPSFGPFEPLAEYSSITGYTWEEVITNGLIEPSGIDIIDNRLLVSDYATGEIIVYDISSIPATELGRISTSAVGIMGIKIGPGGYIYFVDYDTDKVMELSVENFASIQEEDAFSLNLYPNPTNDVFSIQTSISGEYEWKVTDGLGKLVSNGNFTGKSVNIDTELSSGIYHVMVRNTNSGSIENIKLVVN